MIIEGRQTGRAVEGDFHYRQRREDRTQAVHSQPSAAHTRLIDSLTGRGSNY